MKVLVDADTQRIRDAAILGRNGDEVVHSLLDIMAADQPYTVISRAMHIHPTVSELVPTLLQQLEPAGAGSEAPSSRLVVPCIQVSRSGSNRPTKILGLRHFV